MFELDSNVAIPVDVEITLSAVNVPLNWTLGVNIIVGSVDVNVDAVKVRLPNDAAEPV